MRLGDWVRYWNFGWQPMFSDRLKSYLDDPESARAERDRLLAAYRNGNTQALVLPSDLREGPTFEITYDRARDFVSQLRSGSSPFMVIDVQMLLGSGGVLAHLESEGLSVERQGSGTPAVTPQELFPRAADIECDLYHFQVQSLAAGAGRVTWESVPHETDEERAALQTTLSGSEASDHWMECMNLRWEAVQCVMAAADEGAHRACLEADYPSP